MLVFVYLFRVFRLLTELFENESLGEAAVGELLMEKQRIYIDRFVHLLSVGFALPVTEFIARMFRDGQADISLIRYLFRLQFMEYYHNQVLFYFRYFATETLEIVSQPFSQDFVDVFLPIVANKEIIDQSVHDKLPAAKEFIEQCTSAV